MGRRGTGRQSLNSSVVTVANNSVLEENGIDKPADYSQFVKRFGRPDLDKESNVRLIGWSTNRNICSIRDKINSLLNDKTKGQDFALITGPSGTGKTISVRRIAEEYSASSGGDNPKLSFFYLKASWTLERQFGNPETQIRSLFDEAIEKSPSLIFIDKIDLICAEKRGQSEHKDRVFNVLEDKLESLNATNAKVLVLAATDRPEALDGQLRKPCYFGDEIRFTLPSGQDRAEALKYLIEDMKGQLTLEEIASIADKTHCYSFRDLSKLCNIAVKYCNSKKDVALQEAFTFALGQFKPVTIKTITTPCPPLRWTDIGGVDDAKKELQESVIWPLEHREKFKRLGISSNKGALLYGPPGCSKTMLAQALATESGYNFISVKGPELFSKWVGDSEAAVRKLYRNAREIAPCIIFFDEIDGFAQERNDNQSSSVGDKVVAQLLTELNGVEPLDNVFTIAATNRPDRVDSALLRPGRLDPAIYIPLPSKGNRVEIFRVHMRPLAVKFDEPIDVITDKLASKTEGYSGAEIANVCRVAGTLSLRESLDNDHIEWRHFAEALEKVQPRTRLDQLKAYESFQQRTLRLCGDSANSKKLESPVKGETSKLNDLQVAAKGGNSKSSSSSSLAVSCPSNPKISSVGSVSDLVTDDNKKKRLSLNRLMQSLRINKRAK